MTSFVYTTGNPSNLVANQNASMADIQGPFTDLRTFLNGGTMDETNVPNLAAAFTTYKQLATALGQLTTPAAGTYLLTPHQFVNGAAQPAPGATTAYLADFAVELDPARYNANSRTTKLLLDVATYTNAVAPAVTFTFGVYPIATRGGASNQSPFVATLGTVISGSTVAIASPAASSRTIGSSGDFNFPAAGSYAVAVVVSGTPAANHISQFVVNLEMRQV